MQEPQPQSPQAAADLVELFADPRLRSSDFRGRPSLPEEERAASPEGYLPALRDTVSESVADTSGMLGAEVTDR